MANKPFYASKHYPLRKVEEEYGRVVVINNDEIFPVAIQQTTYMIKQLRPSAQLVMGFPSVW